MKAKAVGAASKKINFAIAIFSLSGSRF
jgi:hypothetical protein